MDNKKYNITITPLFSNRLSERAQEIFTWIAGSLPINDEIFDTLQKVERGGKLVVKQFTTPKGKVNAYLEYMTPAQVEAASSSTTPRTVPTPIKDTW